MLRPGVGGEMVASLKRGEAEGAVDCVPGVEY